VIKVELSGFPLEAELDARIPNLQAEERGQQQQKDSKNS
jgi:hypothetical protein